MPDSSEASMKGKGLPLSELQPNSIRKASAIAISSSADVPKSDTHSCTRGHQPVSAAVMIRISQRCLNRFNVYIPGTATA